MNLMAPLEMAAPSFLAWIAPALLVIDALGQEHVWDLNRSLT